MAMDFCFTNFSHFVKKSLKKEYSVKKSKFFAKIKFPAKKGIFFFLKLCQNSPQLSTTLRRSLRYFYFHIFNIAKFG